MADDTILDDAKDAFKIAAEAEEANRAEALDDLNFAIKEEQWAPEIKKQREMDGRPCLTRNLLGPFIRQVVNDGRQNRPAMKVQPVDSDADPLTAEMITGLFRHIEANSNADIAYDTGLEFSVASGLGYLRVNTDYARDDTFDLDLLIQTVSNPFSIYGDPNATSMDGSDWMSAFEVELVPLKQFKRLYKGADEVDWDELGYTQALDPSWQDGSGDNRRLMVANWWQREQIMRPILLLSNGIVVDAEVFKAHPETYAGLDVLAERKIPSYKVTVTKLSGAEVLEKPKTWAGRYIPIVPVYGHVMDINGERRIASLIRSAKDAQRSYNFHHTTATELTALAPKAPFIGPKGAFRTDRVKWENANRQTYPFIEYDIVPGMGAPPQRQAFSGVPAGEMAAAQQAAADMRSIIGMYEASLGQKSNETSGKAILARQREGDTGTAHFLDNLNRAIRHVGRICLDLIPSVYQPDRVTRILGPDGSAQTVQLGAPTPVRDETGEIRKNGDGSAMLHVYDLTKGKYDLIVSAGPGYATKREEAAMQMIELIRAYPMAAPVIGDLLATNLDWPGATEIAKRLRAIMPEQAKGGDSPQTLELKQNLEACQNELMALKRTIENMQGDKEIKLKELEVDQGELKVKEFEAETRRMQALVGKDGVGLTAQDVQALILDTIGKLLDTPDLIEGGPNASAATQVAVPPVEPPQAAPEAPAEPVPPAPEQAPPV